MNFARETEILHIEFEGSESPFLKELKIDSSVDNIDKSRV